MVVLALLVWFIAAMRGGDSSDSASAAASSSLTASQATSASATSASGSATSGVSGTSTTTAAVPPGQCPDGSLAVKATVAQPTWQAGQEPEFGIVITNISTTPCERDLGAGLQQALVYSLDGSQRIWSNADCFPSTDADVRTLKPGEQAAFTVKWSGTTSAPECAGERTPVGPGAYTVVAQLGALRSAPEPFNIA